MEITSNGALLIDDKISLIEEINAPVLLEDNTEFENLRLIQNFFLFNNIPLYTLKDIGSYPFEAISAISSIPSIDVLIIDLDLNSSSQFDEYDISLIVRILNEVKSKFSLVPVIIYSSLADQWEEIKTSIINEDISVSDILADDNVWVIRKGNIKSNELFLETINSKLKKRIVKNLNLKIESAISSSKYWRLEWFLISLCFLFLIFVSNTAFNVKSRLLTGTAVVIILLLFFKLLFKEQKTIKHLKDMQDGKRY